MEPNKKAEWKNFNTPDEVKTFPNGKQEVIRIGGVKITRTTFFPGWKWSASLGPIVKTKSHEEAHFAHQISGRMMILMDNGTQFENVAGDVVSIPKGHDGWVIGDEPVVFVDFQGLIDFFSEEKNKQLNE